MESNHWQVFVNAVAGFWGGLLLAFLTGVLYAFYSAVVMTIFCAGHEHNGLDNSGCVGLFLLMLFMFYCIKFARGGENRGRDICIFCMVVGLSVFLSTVDPLDLFGAGVSFLIILGTPLVILLIFRAVKRRQLQLLEQQADEMERRRIEGRQTKNPQDLEY